MNSKKLRIAVFGTSRSGKDYTVEKAIDILGKKGTVFRHLSPIGMVHDLLGERTLKTMGASEKTTLVDEVRSQLDLESENSNVFIDEHYCFPHTYGGMKVSNGYVDEKLPFELVHDRISGIDYEVVFREEEIPKYDIVVHLDINPTTIASRFQESEGVKRMTFVSPQDVLHWQNFERKHLNMLCRKYRIPLVTLSNPESTFTELADAISQLKTEEEFAGGDINVEND